MSDPALLTRKIQAYLQALSPAAVETLVRGLERARRSGDRDPNLELILNVSVSILRAGSAQTAASALAHRRHILQREFFAPLDTFLISELLPRKQKGRVYRPHLNNLWEWLERDVLQGDIAKALAYLEKVSVHDERGIRMVKSLQGRALDAMQTALFESGRDDRENRRLGMILGGEAVLADVADIVDVYRARPWLGGFLERMPPTLTERNLRNDDDVLSLVRKVTNKFPESMSMVAAAVLERSETPANLGNFAFRLANNRDTKVIGNSRYAPFVDVAVSEVERLNVLARMQLEHNPDPVAYAEVLKNYASLIKGLEVELDLRVNDAWQQRIATSKRDVSQMVTRELEVAGGVVRRALKVPVISDDGMIQTDQDLVDDAVRALRVLSMARGTAETLAVNEISKRARQTVEQTLELVTRSLLDGLGHSKGSQREAYEAAVEIAIMLSEIYFGPEYAAQLKRSRNNALTSLAEKAASSAG